ncbi:MAG: 2-oxoacid:acceptor oxidoreductase family protein [Archaeoglobus sp.]|uniref:2-oxoacid:acceptor oxidoreductase family protein n=1 Tax=Archaeoglobus sp. TaxID=1872626 RepID=UPI001E0A57D0|nr:2-oxoacid:acceptor oxidoreductase family protein [Archaeoglobus sp.]MBO8179516.1 2-oxoacid:acceptor oxidoreductase family protein [Archaeoglobus sp.]
MFLEISIYCRGGQGGVTTARILAAAAMLQGYFSQSMPQFGPERRGAEVRAFLRISDNEIRRKCAVTDPDVVILFDQRLGYDGDPETVVVNCNSKPFNQIGQTKVCQVDATEIAVRHGLVSAGWPILGPAMGGAAAKILDIDYRCLMEAIKMELGDKAEKSMKAAEEAYKVVKCV